MSIVVKTGERVDYGAAGGPVVATPEVWINGRRYVHDCRDRSEAIAANAEAAHAWRRAMGVDQ